MLNERAVNLIWRLMQDIPRSRRIPTPLCPPAPRFLEIICRPSTRTVEECTHITECGFCQRAWDMYLRDIHHPVVFHLAEGRVASADESHAIEQHLEVLGCEVCRRLAWLLPRLREDQGWQPLKLVAGSPEDRAESSLKWAAAMGPGASTSGAPRELIVEEYKSVDETVAVVLRETDSGDFKLRVQTGDAELAGTLWKLVLLRDGVSVWAGFVVLRSWPEQQWAAEVRVGACSEMIETMGQNSAVVAYPVRRESLKEMDVAVLQTSVQAIGDRRDAAAWHEWLAIPDDRAVPEVVADCLRDVRDQLDRWLLIPDGERRREGGDLGTAEPAMAVQHREARHLVRNLLAWEGAARGKAWREGWEEARVHVEEFGCQVCARWWWLLTRVAEEKRRICDALESAIAIVGPAVGQARDAMRSEEEQGKEVSSVDFETWVGAVSGGKLFATERGFEQEVRLPGASTVVGLREAPNHRIVVYVAVDGREMNVDPATWLVALLDENAHLVWERIVILVPLTGGTWWEGRLEWGTSKKFAAAFAGGYTLSATPCDVNEFTPTGVDLLVRSAMEAVEEAEAREGWRGWLEALSNAENLSAEMRTGLERIRRAVGRVGEKRGRRREGKGREG